MPLFSDKVIPTTTNFIMTLVQRKIISIHLKKQLSKRRRKIIFIHLKNSYQSQWLRPLGGQGLTIEIGQRACILFGAAK
jgi:hypothetical protein